MIEEATQPPKDEDTRWAEYWESGYLHSLNRVYQRNYEGAFRDFWNESFSGLGDGHSLLDIGTGNGAVALLAAEYAQSQGIEVDIHAVDRARIDPRRTARERGGDLLDRVTFHPQTPVEALPFDDGTMDLCTGQYAFEYTDLTPAASELYRVLKPGGHGALVCHHDRSVIMQGAVRTQQFAGLVFRELAFLDVVEELVRHIAGAAARGDVRSLAADPAAEAVRARFNQALARVQQAFDAGPGTSFLQVLLIRVQKVLEGAGSTPLESSLAELATLKTELELQRDRTADMQNCVCDERGRQAILDALEGCGFRVLGTNELHDDGPMGNVLVGWTLRVVRD